MIRVGISGLGFMGMVHYLTYQKLPGVEVVAIADRHPERLAGDWTGIKGNFGPQGTQVDLAEVATYATHEELIRDNEVDLVDLCLPPAAHASPAVAALMAGKHVFCEKPMALTTGDCDRMIAAAEEAGRRLLVGHVLPFFPEYAWALREVRGGGHGRVLGASFTRVISDPAWLANFWLADAVGGPLLDLHVHDAHFIRLLFGEPSAVTTRGTTRNGLPEHWHSLLEFGDGGPSVHATSGVLNQPGRPFLHGFEIRMERAAIAFEFAVELTAEGEQAAYTRPPTLYGEDGKARRVELSGGDPMEAFQAELEQVVRVIRQNDDPDVLDAALARDALLLCERQRESLLPS